MSYVAGNDIGIIESQLSDDLSLLGEWFKENELVLNLKKGKTKAMIFETAKHLAMLNRVLKVNISIILLMSPPVINTRWYISIPPFNDYFIRTLLVVYTF